ncbi:MAG: phosphate/phosphite/phosphonate ABC transporter substrate-binding protein [Gammaproteobacteria bacterium]
MPSPDPVTKQRFIACGMYAFTDDLRSAWQSLFDLFFQNFEAPCPVDPVLRFESGEKLIRDPQLLIGQTCGYPLVSQLSDVVTPVCVPLFDVAGCEGKNYSSRLIVSESSDIESLSDCYQGIAAINTSDSNSGMNVLRHAIAPLSQAKPYFSAVRETGSHLKSLTEVAEGKVQIAAIDAVSFSFIQNAWPELVARVRSIGYTAKTCGLPFVIPQEISKQLDSDDITACLNEATLRLPEPIQQHLHLRGFEGVDMDEYQGVLDLETVAQQAGYSQLN